MLRPPFTAIGATKPSITIAAAPARKLPAMPRRVAMTFSSAGDIVEKLPSRRRSVNKALTVLQLLLLRRRRDFRCDGRHRLDTIPAVFCSLTEIVTEKAEFKTNPAFSRCCDFICLAV